MSRKDTVFILFFFHQMCLCFAHLRNPRGGRPAPRQIPIGWACQEVVRKILKKSNRRLIISPPGTKRGRSIQRFWWVFLSQLCSPLQRMCSSLRFRFTISLPPTSPGWRWTKMTRWVLYFQSFISITRIISIFSIHRWSHCPGGSCQSQCDSLWILLRALLRLSRLGPVVWRALRGLRLHPEHSGENNDQGIFENLEKILNPFRPTSSTWLGGTSR